MRTPLFTVLLLSLLAPNSLAQEELSEAAPAKSAGTESELVAPTSRASALEIPVEVLKAQLRPLRRSEAHDHLTHWIDLLHATSLEVRDAELPALEATDPKQAESLTARAVALRGERNRLIERVLVVVDVVERKGGDVEQERTYVSSVKLKPPVLGWRSAWSTTKAWLTDPSGGLTAARNLVLALAILIGFRFLAGILTRIARRATRSLPNASELLKEFITSTVRRVTIVIGLLVALSTLGVNMTPLVAAIGAAGLVIGLALQGTLGNLASGLMIMIYRPFDVDHTVSMAGVGGKVTGMTLMTTSVRTFDNQMIHVPNNKVWGDVITNVNANATRRVDMVFGISYSDDLTLAQATIEKVLEGQEKVLKDPEPVVRVHQLADSSVNFAVRPWAKTPDYWEVYWSVTEKVKRAFDEAQISIPFPQRDLHIVAPLRLHQE